MPDFSRYSRITPESLPERARSGARVTDDMFVKALREISPPLLNEAGMKLLKREIDPHAERRGRRGKSDFTIAELTHALSGLLRSDVPQGFIELLVERLTSGERYTESQRSIDYFWKMKRVERGMIAAGLYSDFRKLIKPNMEEVIHPVLGKFDIKEPNAPLREKALSIVGPILYNFGLGGPAANDRIRNIISYYNTGKLHRSS